MEEGLVSGDTLTEGGGGIICKWMEKHSDLYHRATQHPFILSIRDGTVNISFFKRWLTQDYIFVREFVIFTANLLVKASNDKSMSSNDNKNDIDAILGGMASLNDEVLWFKREASKWGISLFNVAPLKANQDYCRRRIQYTTGAFGNMSEMGQFRFRPILLLSPEDSHPMPGESTPGCSENGRGSILKCS
ncbi:Seed maturation protein PM36 [Zostera marina]|uniref:Seed maturation protein PM36 n=1 Tax=Zostera marina TaxID=29655 RepID=A0A0K9NH85_ZOSMR|nr:Seed maturation protein PM36 [Zostera marina]